jgi:choline transport protein
MSYVVGMTVNIITCVWLIFAIVFFSFPYVKPVSGMSPPLDTFSWFKVKSGC